MKKSGFKPIGPVGAKPPRRFFENLFFCLISQTRW
jgi:hypothetical protein